jgi:uncharacterized membrane protein YjfL (UPF0719 family)
MTLEHFLTSLGLMWAYGGSAVLMLLLTLKLIDWLTPSINVEKELIEKGNMAVAVPVAAFILGVAAIVVACIAS